MTLNTFAAYESAKQRIAKKKHTEIDEALVAAWELGTKLITENKRLMALADERKTTMDAAMERVRMLVARNDILESRHQPLVTLEDLLTAKSQAGEKLGD